MTGFISPGLAALIPAALALCAPFAEAQTPPHAPRAAAGTVDPAAMALLAKVEKTMLNLKTYQAECSTTLAYPPQEGKAARERRRYARLLAVKPNKMRYDQWELKRDTKTGQWTRGSAPPRYTFVCDGKTNWKQFGDHYRTDDRVKPEELSTILEPWVGFYAASSSPRALIVYDQEQGGLLELRRDGTAVVDGVACDKVFAHAKVGFQGTSQESWQTWYVARNGFVRRMVERIEFNGKPGYTRDSVLRNIWVNAPIAAARFTYKPPTGVLSQAENERRNPRPTLLAAGTAAPDFSAFDARNKPVKLSDFKGKVVIVDFWASWCGPCIASMPHNQEVAKKLQTEGLPVVLLAVDNGEERNAFTDWVKANSAKFSALTFVHIPPKTDVSGKLYHVTGIPTQYVVDKGGVVRASFVGYGGPTDDLEKAVRAALTPGAR